MLHADLFHDAARTFVHGHGRGCYSLNAYFSKTFREQPNRTLCGDSAATRRALTQF
jgi:hypothetical protein